MRYVVVFLTLGGLLLWQAERLPWWYGLPVGWAGVSCLAVSAAYAGAGPRVYGKRADGRVAWWAWPLLGPYLLAYRLLWHIVRWIDRKPAAHEVAPGLWLGRRPLPGDVPPQVTCVVDLCVEFPGLAPPGGRYVALPTLDAAPSEPAAFARLATELAAEPGAVLIHCASGHGRSAALAAAVLILRRAAADVDDAERLLRAARPGVRLSPRQRALVRQAVGQI